MEGLRGSDPQTISHVDIRRVTLKKHASHELSARMNTLPSLLWVFIAALQGKEVTRHDRVSESDITIEYIYSG